MPLPLECSDNHLSKRLVTVARTPETRLSKTMVEQKSSSSSLVSVPAVFSSPTHAEPTGTALAKSSAVTTTTMTPPRPPRSTTSSAGRTTSISSFTNSTSRRYRRSESQSQSTTGTQPQPTRRSVVSQSPIIATRTTTIAAPTQPPLVERPVHDNPHDRQHTPTVRVVVRIRPPTRQQHQPSSSSTTPIASPSIVALPPTKGCGTVSTRTAILTNTVPVSSSSMSSIVPFQSYKPTTTTTRTPLDETSVTSNRTHESRTTTLEDSNSCASSLASRTTHQSGFSLLWNRRRRGRNPTDTNGIVSTTVVAAATSPPLSHPTHTTRSQTDAPASDASIASQSFPRLRPFFGRARFIPQTTASTGPHTVRHPVENQALSHQQTAAADRALDLPLETNITPLDGVDATSDQVTSQTTSLSRSVHEWDAVYGPTVPFSQFYTHLMNSLTVETTTTINQDQSNSSSLSKSLQEGQNTTVLLYGATADRNASESIPVPDSTSTGSVTPKSASQTASRHRVVETTPEDFFLQVLNDLFPPELDIPRENHDPLANHPVDVGSPSCLCPPECHSVAVQLSVVELLPTRRVRDLLATDHPKQSNGEMEDDSMSLLSASGSDVAKSHPHRPPTYRGTMTRTTLQSRDHGRHVLSQSMARRHHRHPSLPTFASHVIYTFTVTTTIALPPHSTGKLHTEPITRSTTATPCRLYPLATTTTTGNLTLVDLAGVQAPLFSSSPARRGDDAMTQSHSHDMVVLGQVLTALLHRKSFVPFYYDSALTKILRDALNVNCRVALVACVSPDVSCTQDTVATLHYAEHIRSIPPVAAVLATPPKKKSSVLFDPHGMLTTPSQRNSALQAENMILQARIANLTRRQQGSTDDTATNLHGSILSDSSHQFSNLPTRRGGGSENVIELASLEAKVFRARQERLVTRDRCQTVTAAAERLRLRCQAASMKEPLGRFDQQGKLQSVKVKASLDNNSLKQKINSLVYEKVELCDELVRLATSIEPCHNNASALTIVQIQLQRLSNLLRENEDRLQRSITSAIPHQAGQLKSGSNDHRQELQERIETLTHNIDAATHENETLRSQNKQLVSEIQRLRITNKHTSSTGLNLGGATIDFLGDELDDLSGVNDDNDRLTPEHRNIRSHAALLLDWADRAIQKTRNTPTNDFGEGGSSTIASSLGTDLRPSSCVYRNVGQTKTTIDNENQFLFGNMDGAQNAWTSSCPCQDSVLTSNPAHVEFYLPKLGIMCCCGRKQEVYLNDPDPSHLVNILRDWQVDFLESLGLRTAADLVHAYSSNKHAVKRLAQSMRLWRKERALLSVKTKSCGIALRIWSRTCHAVLTALQDNHAGGRSDTGRPDFLDVSFSSATVSSLGFGNSVSDVNLSRDDGFGTF